MISTHIRRFLIALPIAYKSVLQQPPNLFARNLLTCRNGINGGFLFTMESLAYRLTNPEIFDGMKDQEYRPWLTDSVIRKFIFHYPTSRDDALATNKSHKAIIIVTPLLSVPIRCKKFSRRIEIDILLYTRAHKSAEAEPQSSQWYINYLDYCNSTNALP